MAANFMATYLTVYANYVIHFGILKTKCHLREKRINVEWNWKMSPSCVIQLHASSVRWFTFAVATSCLTSIFYTLRTMNFLIFGLFSKSTLIIFFKSYFSSWKFFMTLPLTFKEQSCSLIVIVLQSLCKPSWFVDNVNKLSIPWNS